MLAFLLLSKGGRFKIRARNGGTEGFGFRVQVRKVGTEGFGFENQKIIQFNSIQFWAVDALLLTSV